MEGIAELRRWAVHARKKSLCECQTYKCNCKEAMVAHLLCMYNQLCVAMV